MGGLFGAIIGPISILAMKVNSDLLLFKISRALYFIETKSGTVVKNKLFKIQGKNSTVSKISYKDRFAKTGINKNFLLRNICCCCKSSFAYHREYK